MEQQIKKLSELNSWLSNSNKIDSQSHTYYILRCDVGVTSTFAYCGQAYPGASNYHDAPKELRNIVSEELQKAAPEIVQRAIVLYRQKLLNNIASLRADYEATIARALSDDLKANPNP